MPAAITRQRSTSRSSSKRPESPIKRGSSARLGRSARSPSPFSPNTSHNEMPSSLTLDADSTVLLKPSQPIRRRSTRLSAATGKASTGTPNEVVKATSVKRSISMNGHNIQASSSIDELDEPHAEAMTAEPAVPNGHGASISANGFSKASETYEVITGFTPAINDLRESPLPAPLVNAKPKIDWEVPRKALHSSIG